MLLLLRATIEHACAKRKNFDPNNATPEEIVEESAEILEPLIKYLNRVSDTEFLGRFGEKYGSGGPPEYFLEMAQIIWDRDKTFAPDGLLEYIESKDERRIKDAESTIKFIENRVTEIVINYFKKIHGSNYWNYVGTKEMRVKAYERQQEEAPEKQLDMDAYLDFIDKKKIIEKSENWPVFKPYFDIPLPNEKGFAKNLKWMDRLNELRRVVAHPHKRSFRSEDLEFLEWIKMTFEEKLLRAGSQQLTLTA
jgi:hypothetical protein